MKLALGLVVVVTLSAGHVLAADFRNVTWGMKYEQVVDAENGNCNSVVNQLVSRPNMLVCNTKTGNVFVNYEFEKSGLTSGSIMIIKDSMPDTEYAQIVEDFEKAITEKYGAPKKEVVKSPVISTRLWESKRSNIVISHKASDTNKVFFLSAYSKPAFKKVSKNNYPELK